MEGEEKKEKERARPTIPQHGGKEEEGTGGGGFLLDELSRRRPPSSLLSRPGPAQAGGKRKRGKDE